MNTTVYASNSPLFAVDGRISVCKKCFVSNSIDQKTGEVVEEKLKNMLRKMDLPFYRDVLQSSANQFAKEHKNMDLDLVKNHGAEIVGIYMKNINSLPQLRKKNFADSEEDEFVQHNSKVLDDPNAEIDLLTTDKIKGERKHYGSVKNFEVTKEMVALFGDGYSTIEYKLMYEKYERLKINYSLQTNLHQEALATYVRFKVKEEMATSRGNVDEAKKWYDAAQNAADKAKLSPKQLTQADLHGGINSFSEIFKAVEQAVDVIPILPSFKSRPNDSCDFVIWCFINYIRDLQGLPQCTYEDVYKFYDTKKAEYIAQYGDPYNIFDDDKTEELRPSIEQFITLPKDYNDTGDEE